MSVSAAVSAVKTAASAAVAVMGTVPVDSPDQFNRGGVAKPSSYVQVVVVRRPTDPYGGRASDGSQVASYRAVVDCVSNYETNTARLADALLAGLLHKQIVAGSELSTPLHLESHDPPELVERTGTWESTLTFTFAI